MRSRTPGSARDGDQAGFTLIEILAVLVVLGLAAALLAAHGPQRSAGLDLRTAVQEVAGSLRLARSRAIAGNRVVGVAFDGAARTLALDGTQPRALPPGVAVAVTATFDPATDQQAGEAASHAVTGIRFAPDGSSTGGRVDLRDAGRRVRVAVDWLTGRVTVLSLGADAT